MKELHHLRLFVIVSVYCTASMLFPHWWTQRGCRGAAITPLGPSVSAWCPPRVPLQWTKCAKMPSRML